MRRMVISLLVLAVALFAVAQLVAQDDRREVEALVGATYQEADEGYFSFGQDTMVVAKRGSALHKWLKSHVGQRMRLTFQPDGKGPVTSDR